MNILLILMGAVVAAVVYVALGLVIGATVYRRWSASWLSLRSNLGEFIMSMPPLGLLLYIAAWPGLLIFDLIGELILRVLNAKKRFQPSKGSLASPNVPNPLVGNFDGSSAYPVNPTFGHKVDGEITVRSTVMITYPITSPNDFVNADEDDITDLKRMQKLLLDCGYTITLMELHAAYRDYCEERGSAWEILPVKDEDLKALLFKIFRINGNFNGFKPQQ